MKNSTVSIKKLFTISSACILIFLFGACKKEVFDQGLTKEFSIQSAADGANYNIKVGLPANYNSSTEKYATLYVLDGEENFEFVANECKKISDNYGIQNVLVISIGYGNDRSLDYTPTKTSSTTGGAPQFLHFLETQLIPKIEQDFRAITRRDSRIILGHSYGGLFGAYAYCVNNKLFGNYLLLSPSLWFDNLVSFQLETDNRVNNKNAKQLVFMGLGEAENYGKMQAPFEGFFQILKDNYTNIRLEKNRVKNLDHLGSKRLNIVKGLEFYFQNR